MNWDVKKTRSENCQLRILRRRTCSKTLLQLILSDSSTLAYEHPPSRRGGGGGVEGALHTACDPTRNFWWGGFHCNWSCVRITESGVRKVTDFPLHPHENKSPSRKYKRSLQSNKNGLMSEALGIFCEITLEFLVTTKMQDCRKTFHLYFIE